MHIYDTQSIGDGGGFCVELCEELIVVCIVIGEKIEAVLVRIFVLGCLQTWSGATGQP